MKVQVLVNNGDQRDVERRLLLNKLEADLTPREMVDNRFSNLTRAARGVMTKAQKAGKVAKSAVSKSWKAAKPKLQKQGKALGIQAKRAALRGKKFAKSSAGKMTMGGAAAAGLASGSYAAGRARGRKDR